MVCAKVSRIAKQEVVCVSARRASSIPTDICLRQFATRSIYSDDAVHNHAHLVEVVDCKKNHGDENQSHDGQAIGNSASQGATWRNYLERFSQS